MSERKPYDFVLARSIRSTNVNVKEFVLAKYDRGCANMQDLDTAHAVMRGSSLENLSKTHGALVWEGDRVFAYNGPSYSNGLGKIICPATAEDLREFIRAQPSD